MQKHLLFAALAAAVAVGLSYAQQSVSKVEIPVHRTSAHDGKEMYVNYCAPCHGLDGKGDGPVTPALRKAPTDLTVLTRDNSGKFPSSHVVAALEFGPDIPAHGSKQMPVWGPILGNMNRGISAQRQLRIHNLTDYLQSIQEK